MARGLLVSTGMSNFISVGELRRPLDYHADRSPGLLSVGEFHRSLDYHAERHNVLASNVANTNTPGFRPRELLRVENDEFHNTLPLYRTEHEHIVGQGVPAVHKVVTSGDDWNVDGLDGNNVSLEREMSKLEANDLRYQGASRLVTRHLAMLRYAANDGSSAG